MSSVLPPVEEVTKRALDGNEKKLRAGKSVGGKKREWWLQNMKAESRKPQRIRVKNVQDQEVEDHHQDDQGVDRGNATDWEQSQREGGTGKGESWNDFETTDMTNHDDLPHQQTHSVAISNLMELKIEELDAIDSVDIHLKSNESLVEKESQQHLKRFGNEAMFDLTGEEATVSYIRHKRVEDVVSPCLEGDVTPPHQLLACLLCLALSLVLLGLLLSSLLVAPIGSWFKVQGDLGEEEPCLCSCPI